MGISTEAHLQEALLKGDKYGSDDDTEGTTIATRPNSVLPSWINRFMLNAGLIAVLMGLTSLITFCLTQAALSPHTFGSFDRGYVTEFEPIKGAIETKHEIMYGTLLFHKDGEPYIASDSPVWKYIGDGNSADPAWSELYNPHWFFLTEEEAIATFGETHRDYWDEDKQGYKAFLGVFHNIHCLNMLRLFLHSEERFASLKNFTAQVTHLEHCTSYLLQDLMCKSDLHLIPTKFSAGYGGNYLYSERPQTCRDFRKIKAWVTERVDLLGPHRPVV